MPHYQLEEIIVPGGDEGEDRQRADTRLDHGQHDVDEGARLSRAVDAGGLQHFIGNALGKLLHQEHAEGPAHGGQDDGPEGVMEL